MKTQAAGVQHTNGTRRPTHARLESFLQAMVERQASDLHLVPGSPPVLRVSTDLVPLEDEPPLSGNDTRELLELLAGQGGLLELEEKKDIDFAYEAEGMGRFRVNASVQRSRPVLTMRRIHSSVPDLDALGVPPVCRALAMKPRGLVLVTGAVNSGKSTTMAAMIEYLNRTVPKRIVTIEDPIEYVYPPEKCLITQRELGPDVPSFASGLRSALRQDPNVILVGEMRDAETVAACLTAAETGHLVMSTLHTPSAAQAIDRLVDVFPSAQQNLVRHRLAGLLEGVLYQVLMKRREGPGRVLAAEVMLGTTAIRALIREGRTHQIPNVIHTSTDVGMQTMDQALLKLYRSKEISQDDLMLYCSNPDEMQRLLGVVSAR